MRAFNENFEKRSSGRMFLIAAAAISLLAVTSRNGKAQSDTACVALVDSMHKGLAPSGGRGGRGGGRGADTAGVRTRALACADYADTRRRLRVFEAISAQMVSLAQLPWMIPEYHDEQPFAFSNTYGPMAYIFASPFIGGFKYEWQIREQGSHGILAAVVFVDAPASTTLSTPYTRLFLQPGMNCIWLANTAGSGGGNWRAFVTAASGAPPLCDRSTPGNELRVSRETFAPLRHDDYPSAARFGESADGQPLLGLRCVDAWCELGPAGFSPTPGLGGVGRERLVRGWHDVQKLSVRDASGVLHPGPRARIVPEPDLDHLSSADFATWRRVAEITFVDDPAGTKYAKWGLRRGANSVEGIFSGGRWLYRVTAGATTTIWTHVIPMPHLDAAVPGTVRWRWTLLDEGIWIPCGDACCHADGE